MALVGAWNDNDSKGAARVLTARAPGSGASRGRADPHCEVGEGRFGVSVALSADGDTALIGALYDNGARGASWVYRRTGTTWTQEGGKLTGGGESGESEFGTNVALSADGATALIGGWRDNGGAGASWVFADPPSATTGAATGVDETSAILNGTLGGGGSRKAHFQYGTTTAYGDSTTAQTVGSASGSARSRPRSPGSNREPNTTTDSSSKAPEEWLMRRSDPCHRFENRAPDRRRKTAAPTSSAPPSPGNPCPPNF